VLLAVGVTAVAGDFLMCTVEDEVSQRMIKRGCYQLDDDLVPALVIRVTARTLEALRFGQAPVQAAIPVEIIAHICMTGDAQLKLRLIGQWIVAVFAGIFCTRMTAHDGTRHDQPFLQCRGFRRPGINEYCQCSEHINQEQAGPRVWPCHQYRCTTRTWSTTVTTKVTKKGKCTLCHKENIRS